MIKTVILCGGRGLRLRPLTDDVPKPLVTISGKPILQHLVESYIRKGFNEFILCIGYRGYMIRDLFEGLKIDATIEFSDTGVDSSILERLYSVKSLVGNQFFIAYGDTLIDMNLDQMLNDHVNSGASATITTANVRSPFGLVTTDGDNVVCSFDEKPVQTFYVGHMMMNRQVISELDHEYLQMPDGDGLVAVFKKLISQKVLNIYSYEGPQITFNTHQELQQAEQAFISFFTHQEETTCL